MTAVSITFNGGAEAGDVGSTTWGNDSTGKIVFPIRVPVFIDPEKAANKVERDFLTHIIKKARGNPFFDVKDGDAKDFAKGTQAVVEKAKPRGRKSADADTDDDAA